MYSLLLNTNSPVYQVEMLLLWFTNCIGDFGLCQLSSLSSSVGRASRQEYVRHGFESHLSAAFSLEKVVSGLVLCYDVLLRLSPSLSLFLNV